MLHGLRTQILIFLRHIVSHTIPRFFPILLLSLPDCKYDGVFFEIHTRAPGTIVMVYEFIDPSPPYYFSDGLIVTLSS